MGTVLWKVLTFACVLLVVIILIIVIIIIFIITLAILTAIIFVFSSHGSGHLRVKNS
jgi:hypothetical protein